MCIESEAGTETARIWCPERYLSLGDGLQVVVGVLLAGAPEPPRGVGAPANAARVLRTLQVHADGMLGLTRRGFRLLQAQVLQN